MRCLGIVRELFDELNNNILYCHWKSNQHFSDALMGIDDLDILIEKKQYGDLVVILNKLNFKRFYTPNSRTYVGIEDFLGYDEKTGLIVHLHLHLQLAIGEKHLKGFNIPIESKILNDRRWNESEKAFLSSEFDELLLLIIRMGMKLRFRDKFKENLVEKGTNIEFDWLKCNCLDFSNYLENEQWLSLKMKDAIVKIYNEGINYTNIKKLNKLLYKEFAVYSQGSFLSNTCNRHINEFRRIILEIKKRTSLSQYTFLRRRLATGGIVIAFIGSDGAGKSSAIKEIQSWLIQVMDVRNFYLGSGDGNSSFLRRPLKLAKEVLQKNGTIKRTNNFSDEKLEKKEISKLKMYARGLWIYTLSQERIKKLIAVRRCRQRGFVVITDRYPQNEFPGLCDGRKLEGEKSISARKEDQSYKLAQLSPPDIAIKLIVSPEKAMERKPGEIEYATSKSLTNRIKNLVFSDSTKCIEIDADGEQEKVLLSIKKTIWDSL